MKQPPPTHDRFTNQWEYALALAKALDDYARMCYEVCADDELEWERVYLIKLATDIRERWEWPTHVPNDPEIKDHSR